MPKTDDFTAGYTQTDTDAEPAITFGSIFGGAESEGVITKPVRGYEYTDTGLEIRRELTADDWRGMLPEIKAIHSAYQFIVGDWAVYGVEHGYEDSYAAVATLTGFEASTVEFYASICRKIPRLVRTNRLTFGHYQRIAPLPEEDRAAWIQYAAENNLSIKALREAIANPQLPAGDAPAFEDDPESDRPALSDEMAAIKVIEEEATEIPDIAIKEVKKQLRAFVHHVETDTLQAMPQDDLYLLMIYVQRKYAERKKLGK